MSLAEKFIQMKTDYDEVYVAGQEKGRQAERSDFWDAFQNNGQRYLYDYAFAEKGGISFWSKGFTPKYPIYNVGSLGEGVFYYFGYSLAQPIDFVNFLKENQIRFSRLHHNEELNYIECGAKAFYYANVSRLPIIKTTQLNYHFYYCKNLITIDGIEILTSNSCSSAFTQCTKLENVTFLREISCNGINFQHSPLSKASLTNIIEMLSSTATGKSITFKKSSVDNAFETSLGFANGSTSEEWLNLIATKSNWTISLV